MKFAKSFYACKPGEVYPTRFAPGDDCPREIEDKAKKAGVLETPKRRVKSDDSDD